MTQPHDLASPNGVSLHSKN